MRFLFCTLSLLFAGTGVAWAASASAPSAEKAVPSEEAAEDEAEEGEPADDVGFERYKTIMDRMPFGREPSGFNPDAPPGTAPAGGGRGGSDAVAEEAARTEEERRILSSVRVSAINVTPSGKVAVGFTDSTAQPAVNYYLKVGESRDGWLVKDADADELKATLAKGDVEVELGLGQGQDGGKSVKGARGGRQAGAPPLPAAGRSLLSHRPPIAGRSEASPAGGSGALAGLRSRRAERERRAAEAAARKAAADAAAKQEAAEKEAEAARVREQTAADREQTRVALQQVQEQLQNLQKRREAESEAQEEADSSDGQDE